MGKIPFPNIQVNLLISKMEKAGWTKNKVDRMIKSMRIYEENTGCGIYKAFTLSELDGELR